MCNNIVDRTFIFNSSSTTTTTTNNTIINNNITITAAHVRDLVVDPIGISYI